MTQSLTAQLFLSHFYSARVDGCCEIYELTGLLSWGTGGMSYLNPTVVTNMKPSLVPAVMRSRRCRLGGALERWPPVDSFAADVSRVNFSSFRCDNEMPIGGLFVEATNWTLRRMLSWIDPEGRSTPSKTGDRM